MAIEVRDPANVQDVEVQRTGRSYISCLGFGASPRSKDQRPRDKAAVQLRAAARIEIPDVTSHLTGIDAAARKDSKPDGLGTLLERFGPATGLYWAKGSVRISSWVFCSLFAAHVM